METINNNTNRKLLGDIGEAKARLHFIQEGYDIFTPDTINPAVDLIVMKEGIISTVQVKATSRDVVKLETCYMKKGTNVSKYFDAELYDLLFVYHQQSDTYKVVNAKTYHGKSQATYKLL